MGVFALPPDAPRLQHSLYLSVLLGSSQGGPGDSGQK